MQFSIIIPTLNEAKAIKPCLLALQVIRESSIACEIIIVDGGSTDNTQTIAKPFADKVIISAKGRAKQMNKGAKLATGKTLLFLHADTYLPNNALEIINFTSSSSTVFWGRFDIALKGHSFMLKIISVLMNWRSRFTGIATGDQVIFVSKKLFNDIKGYPDISLMEDISLSASLKKMSPPICLKQTVTSSGRRWEQFGFFKTILLMWSLRLRYFLGENPEQLSVLYSRGLFWNP